MPGTNSNIACGDNFDCRRIVLTLSGTEATLLLESRKGDTPDGPSVVQSVTLMPAEVTLVPQLSEKVKVLSLNNSLIHYNDQDVMFNDIAQGMGKDAQWTKHTLLGQAAEHALERGRRTG